MIKKTLMQCLLDAGYPREDMAHHESDLYVYDTPLVRHVLKQYCLDNGWDRLADKVKGKWIKEFAFSTFEDLITGRMMFDLTFAYTEGG